MTDTVAELDCWKHGEHSKRTKALKLIPKLARVLLAAEWARSVLPIFEAKWPGDHSPRKAIEAAEQYARTGAYAAHTAAAYAAAAYAAHYADYADYAAHTAAAHAAAHAADYAAHAADYAAHAADYAAHAADYAAYAADAATARESKWAWVAATYRACRGPGIEFSPEWRTATVLSLAVGIRDRREFDLFPILADALQDAGCDCPGLMQHMQSGSDTLTAADWSVWQSLSMGGPPRD